MARYNEILIGRWNRGIQKLVGIKGEPPSPQLSTEIAGTFVLPLGVEFRYLESWNRYGIVIFSGGQVGLFTTWQLRVPTASNVIAVVERLSVRSSTAGQGFNLRLKANATDQSSVNSNAIRLDARIGTQGPAAIISSGTAPLAAGLFANMFEVTAQQDQQFMIYENHEIVVAPGDTLSVDNTQANTDLNVAVIWRERYLEESERS